MDRDLYDKIVARFKTAQQRLVTQGSDLSLGSIAEMVTSGAIDPAPHYQRRERWSGVKQSALIESFLLNVPVPPIYLAEDEFGEYSIVDGKQRITAITNFLRDELKLTGLEELSELEGFQFSRLPIELQNTLKVRPYLRVITLLKQSDSDLKYEVFTRLNRGGESMTAQEIRNVAYRGPLNDAICRLAETDSFLRDQLKIRSERSSAYQRMLDAEYVLRFLTLKDRWTNFSGDLQHEMNTFMRRNRHAKNDFIEGLVRDYEESIATCRKLWGDLAFKRPLERGWRDQFLAGMYDAQMVAVYVVVQEGDLAARLDSSLRSRVQAATRDLFGDSDFDEAVRQATNTPSRIRYRIDTVVRMLTDFAGR